MQFNTFFFLLRIAAIIQAQEESEEKQFTARYESYLWIHEFDTGY